MGRRIYRPNGRPVKRYHFVRDHLRNDTCERWRGRHPDRDQYGPSRREGAVFHRIAGIARQKRVGATSAAKMKA